MAPIAQLLTLPRSILLLLATAATSASQDLPDNQPAAAAAHWARDEILIHRFDEAVQAKLALAPPVGVRKMSGDEGEKFFLEYWQFNGIDDDNAAPTSHAPSRRSSSPPSPPSPDAAGSLSNLTMALPPYLLHEEPLQQSPLLARLAPRAALEKRFQCPSNTQNCSSIDRPNSCCATGETCVIVTDTGLGDVGCCPAGEQCGGQVSGCDPEAGYSSCPDSPNGGCCIPNYTCMGIGCITVGGSTTVTTTLPLATVTSVQTSSSSSSSSSSSPSAEIPTVTTTTTLSFSGTATALPPGRPTGDSSSSSSSTPSSSSSITTPSSTSVTAIVTTYTTTQSGIGGACPTGFYQCSAYYGGGCCRVGRDCQSTSCPIPATQTVVISNGVTIVAGSGSTPAPPGTDSSATTTVTGTSTIIPGGGSCANGWYSCALSDGGGCCPSGYACGSICTATVSGAQQSTVQKISIGPRVEMANWITWAATGAVSLVGMLMM